jgi:ACS family allantoate permease-like MFS transporter
MTIMTMFYTRVEATQRISWTFQCNGFASIIASFTAFGVAHIRSTKEPHQWQWFMIILSIISLIVSVLYFRWFPDNPAQARFLTNEEKTDIVKRQKANQNGIEAKKWKRYQ